MEDSNIGFQWDQLGLEIGSVVTNYSVITSLYHRLLREAWNIVEIGETASEKIKPSDRIAPCAAVT